MTRPLDDCSFARRVVRPHSDAQVVCLRFVGTGRSESSRVETARTYEGPRRPSISPPSRLSTPWRGARKASQVCRIAALNRAHSSLRSFAFVGVSFWSRWTRGHVHWLEGWKKLRAVRVLLVCYACAAVHARMPRLGRLCGVYGWVGWFQRFERRFFAARADEFVKQSNKYNFRLLRFYYTGICDCITKNRSCKDTACQILQSTVFVTLELIGVVPIDYLLFIDFCISLRYMKYFEKLQRPFQAMHRRRGRHCGERTEEPYSCTL